MIYFLRNENITKERLDIAIPQVIGSAAKPGMSKREIRMMLSLHHNIHK